MSLKAGDRVMAYVAGKTGRGTVLEDQDGETVKFQWDQGRPGSKPVLAHRARVVLIQSAPATTPVMTVEDLIETVERRYDRT